jgi:beta-N-acetylhexosaminidase
MEEHCMTAEDARWADDLASRLPLEERIAQMITVEAAGGYVADDDPRLARLIGLVRDLGVGGVVVYGGTPRDVARLANRLQQEAALPLLISADFEGGPGQQVAGASEFPADMALSAAGSEDLAYAVGAVGGVEGRAMGIHLTYSPVADITARPGNPAESVRTFGGDLDLLGRMIRAYIRGYHSAGMLTTAKHFPGRGDVSRMPGEPLFQQIDKPAAEVEAGEFRAFRHAIEGGVDFVMTEHLAVPSVTGGSKLPASVEPELVTGWLRDRLGFEGIVTSDDLWYDHVVERFGKDDVAVRAIAAGHDVILKPKDPVTAVRRIAEAVRAGEIPESRILGSVAKILAVKARLGLHRDRLVDEAAVGGLVGTAAHLAVVRSVADRSLTLLKNDGVLPVAAASLRKIVNVNVQKADNDPSPAGLAARLRAAFPGTASFDLHPDSDPAVHDRVRTAAGDAGLVVFSLFVPRDRLGSPAPLRERDAALIDAIAKAKPGRTIAMSYGNPYLVDRIDGVGAFAVGWGEKGWFGNQAVYFDTFIGLLSGTVVPEGRLPVRVSDRYPIGAGVRR